MLDIGFQEMLILGVIALLVFGPYKLPELGRALGRAIREFRRASDEFRSTIETNLQINSDPVMFPPSAEAPADTLRAAETSAPLGAGVDSSGLPAPSDAVPSGAPQEAGVPAGAGADGEGGGLSFGPVDPFCAQRGGRLFHRSTCAWAARIPESDRIVLKRAAEGGELGLLRCPVCDPVDADTSS
jgi:sec-independent protein translocase protein TatA